MAIPQARFFSPFFKKKTPLLKSCILLWCSRNASKPCHKPVIVVLGLTFPVGKASARNNSTSVTNSALQGQEDIGALSLMFSREAIFQLDGGKIGTESLLQRDFESFRPAPVQPHKISSLHWHSQLWKKEKEWTSDTASAQQGSQNHKTTEFQNP